jgi:Ca-dependent carbohydrate-binding module xylan-binding/Fibronectin type III domain
MKPIMSIYLGSIAPTGSLAEVTVDSSWQTYRLTLRGDGRALLLVFVNDYWDPDAGEDVNLYIKQVVYKPISSISNGADTFTGNSFLVSWNANHDSDLAGYSVHLGHQSRAYFAKYNTADTTYRFSGLPSDTVYYVAVTAIDAVGNESGFSEEKMAKLVDQSLPQPPSALVINHSAFGPDDFSYAGEARQKDESAYIPGSYDHILIDRSPNGAFDLEVMARGDVVRDLKPVMRVYLGKIAATDSLAEVTVDSSWQTYHLALRGDGRPLFLVFVNDYWNPAAGEDVNLYIKHVIYNVAGTGAINITGNSFFASWNANDEPNLAGYHVHLGYQPHVYFFMQATASPYFRFLDLPSDTLYYVAVTAIDAAGHESNFSEEKMVRLVSSAR